VLPIHIEQITSGLTWRLRQQVLYPAGNMMDMAMPEDEDGTHFGAFFENKLIGVISLFHNGTDFQFRKLAVSPPVQGKGIGTQLLQYVADHAADSGATRLLCNARTTAIPFYLKAGFKSVGETFMRNGIAYIVMDKSL
jgi:GNAT superfamily N-acetyltransferase